LGKSSGCPWNSKTLNVLKWAVDNGYEFRVFNCALVAATSKDLVMLKWLVEKAGLILDSTVCSEMIQHALQAYFTEENPRTTVEWLLNKACCFFLFILCCIDCMTMYVLCNGCR